MLKKIFWVGLNSFLLLSLSSCGYNRLQGLDEDVKASWSEVENQYKRRADLIENLVQTVKGYAKFERETLESVIQARAKATQTQIEVNGLSNAQAFQQFQNAQGELGQALSRLMVVVERYPDLKANQNFRDLQTQIEGTENRIAVARGRYISKVAEYNKGIRYFPTNLTAKYLLHLEERATFTATEKEKETPQVQF